MMNRSKIDWCDFSWNPITGCRHECAYCYARKQSRRFCGDIRLNLTSAQVSSDEDGLFALREPFHNAIGKVVPMPAGFAPTLHEYRLSAPFEKKLPANIFVGSMADVFGDWIPDEWIRRVFGACEAAPWHNYMFLTKNPRRYERLDALGSLPAHRNWFYGSTLTTAEDLMFTSTAHNTFLSIEPLHGDFDGCSFDGIDWIIIGAEFGSRKDKIIPAKRWVTNICDITAASGIPVFMKSSLEGIMGKDFRQEMPRRLTCTRWDTYPAHKVFIEAVRGKKKCRQCRKSVRGKPAVRISSRFYICQKCYWGGHDEQKQEIQSVGVCRPARLRRPGIEQDIR